LISSGGEFFQWPRDGYGLAQDQ